MKSTKKVLALVLTLALVFALAAPTAMAKARTTKIGVGLYQDSGAAVSAVAEGVAEGAGAEEPGADGDAPPEAIRV